VSHLSSVSVVDTVDAEAPRPHANAGTVEEQVGRYRDLAEAGVQTAIVNMPDLATNPAALPRFADVIAAFKA
jgi:hypothetical protein